MKPAMQCILLLEAIDRMKPKKMFKPIRGKAEHPFLQSKQAKSPAYEKPFPATLGMHLQKLTALNFYGQIFI
jgi:hypothetical protein